LELRGVYILRLSTKGRYGLKAMFDLAINSGNGPVALNSIGERQNISVNYLEQLFKVLRDSGFVKSIRGAQGGYMLAKDPKDITVGDIIRTLEGPIAPSDCVLDNDSYECIKADYCITRTIWERIKKSIDTVIDSITLQDMIDDYNKLHNENR